MAEQPRQPQPNWMENEDELWSGIRKKQQRRRDVFWLVFAVLLFLVGNLLGFPGRFFT